jgi:CheY-like chemotaxis protein
MLGREASGRACEFSQLLITIFDVMGPVVLIVEDDPETRQYYQSVFELDGFRTEEAHNGLQAFEKATLAAPDIILTDIAVPGIDGIELCRRIRADHRTRSIPVLAVTGYEDRGYSDRAMDAGADCMLTKPCPPASLIAEARRLLEGSRMLRARATEELARADAALRRPPR